VFGSMFRNQDEEPAGRYHAELIEGHIRWQSHQAERYGRLNRGEQQGRRLVSASTSNAIGIYFTSIYWYTKPER
jgi:hypothetical protein